VGVVFQEPRLLPWLTVEQNLRLVVTDGVPEPDVPALLATVGLADAAALRPGELSLGMARRVAVARALAIDPAVLVLDEPFVSLDRQRAGVLGGLLRARARRHGTLVLVTMHDVDHAIEIADRILVLSGEPAELAADLVVPERDAPAAREALRQDLLTRFAFLTADAEEDADAPVS
jgi:NitT/TauT family transport system ATP-binding protein